MGRLKFAAKVSAIHFSISFMVAAILAYVVFFIWYPEPLSSVTGSFKLFWLLVSIDVICGPLLTLILSNPKKSRKEMALDLSLVAVIQLSAFIYGIYHVYEARPVVVVFEVDRLRVLSPVDIAVDELPEAPESYQELPLFSHFMLSTRQAKDGDDKLDAIEKSLSGIDIGQRPTWWIPYSEDLETIKNVASPVSDLKPNLKDADKKELADAIAQVGIEESQLYYLPLTSARTNSWIALLDGDMSLLGSAPIDAFSLTAHDHDSSAKSEKPKEAVENHNKEVSN